ncbi:hypothetical protein VII00023_09531 [Vibrio ichthyoenteri ATCC 700023]|uniref:tRNA(Met) cytidine acetyltransferase TmcA n=1 Tax=Vibrio ichthyoenteri ATCC 700023 TaxID=870968 RepID=F9RZ23_9VIBR|nr:GNAT family N-acetyltransferase [Vibrio ichthyoenteri]EGU46099.1 hypothetical protein VII00023_09531 [Vibrio ichthyoenteri ATCC 700023]
MNAIEQYLQSLSSLAVQHNHRFGFTLRGDADWQQAVCQKAIALSPEHSFQLGGNDVLGASRYLAYNKGQQFLGQECSLLLVDLRQGFDANSLTSALGTLRGGGCAGFIVNSEASDERSLAWLLRACDELLCIEQDKPLPAVPSYALDTESKLGDWSIEMGDPSTDSAQLSQQTQAIERIAKVVTGHRRRPLVLTADRGRGKTSALGIAAAQLMLGKKIKILVTSPSINNIAPLFEHAQRLLPDSFRTKVTLLWQQSSIEYIAPDELLRNKPSCDLLMVDEASAIPLPMLFSIVEHYHRAVFSTTIHGYEGCGRGFTLKFQAWLREHRPGTSFYHMDTPIRWASQDPLEQWQYETFLLDAELADVEVISQDKTPLRFYSQDELFASPALLRQCFALLVNAHYQTTPNDLMLLLSDPAMKLWARFEGRVCMGCIIGVEEGSLSAQLIESVRQGKRRPKGHLVATTLANHLGLDLAAQQSSLRIMRIAVHPSWQSKGIGSAMLSQLEAITDYAFYSTSYGVTPSLFNFWLSNQYLPAKLGSQRDQASGCHSLVMVKGQQPWVAQAVELFHSSLAYQLKDIFHELEVSLVSHLAASECLSLAGSREQSNAKLDQFDLKLSLIKCYIEGGSNYENVAGLIEQLFFSANVRAELPLLIRKVIQQWSWQRCADEFNLTGRKQLEQALRIELQRLVKVLSI